jgi:flagellar motor switch protein FliN/FliY
MRMRDDSISQVEIDALVRGIAGELDLAPAAVPADSSPDPSVLQTVLRTFVDQAGQALSDLVGLPCHATLAEVTVTSYDGINLLIPNQFFVGRTLLQTGQTGSLYYLLPMNMGLAMITQIYGGVAPSTLDDSALGALADGLTQMNQAGWARLSEQYGKHFSADPVEVFSVRTLAEALPNPGVPVVAVGFNLVVGDDVGRIYIVISQELAAHLQRLNVDQIPSPRVPVSGGKMDVREVKSAKSDRQTAAGASPMPMAPAQFPDLSNRSPREEIRNIELLMDVTLQVTVELGRTRRQIRDVLALGPGSVLELDRLAGEQVDVLVNGKLIAKAEVVVIDENYGVRITDIISPVDRVQSLK